MNRNVDDRPRLGLRSIPHGETGPNGNQAMQSAIEAFERRMTRRFYAVATSIVLLEALVRRFWV